MISSASAALIWPAWRSLTMCLVKSRRSAPGTALVGCVREDGRGHGADLIVRQRMFAAQDRGAGSET